jgi:hypothetical protein
MSQKYSDPSAPEVLNLVLQKIKNMSREEWEARLAWYPADVEDPWPAPSSSTACDPEEALLLPSHQGGEQRAA